tara:strand:+ start:4141 stop:5001 length:861 start_codon:yes stop_codon:yes gene_type:complete
MFQINWKTKSYLYKIFEFFKLKKILYFVQKHITKRSLVHIAKVDKSWKFHADSIKKYNVKNLLEVGAGKSLEQNIFFSYFFNNKIKQTVIDINKMLDLALFNEANRSIAKILNVNNKGNVNSLEELELKYNIFYKAPYSISDVLKSKEVFDICVSTTTLEHFTKKDIDNLLSNLKRIIKKNGHVSSAIDYSDHYSHTDKNINTLNFLKYDETEWQKYNNSFLYQNRLRHRDYEKIFNLHGYKIKDNIEGPRGEALTDLSREYNPSDKSILILWGYYLIENNLEVKI